MIQNIERNGERGREWRKGQELVKTQEMENRRGGRDKKWIIGEEEVTRNGK